MGSNQRKASKAKQAGRHTVRDNSELPLDEQRELKAQQRENDRAMRNEMDYARAHWRELGAALQHESSDLDRTHIVRQAQLLQQHVGQIIVRANNGAA